MGSLKYGRCRILVGHSWPLVELRSRKPQALNLKHDELRALLYVHLPELPRVDLSVVEAIPLCQRVMKALQEIVAYTGWARAHSNPVQAIRRLSWSSALAILVHSIPAMAQNATGLAIDTFAGGAFPPLPSQNQFLPAARIACDGAGSFADGSP